MGFPRERLDARGATIGEPGRARRGASGSLNPQAAIAGLNSLSEGAAFEERAHGRER